MVTAGHKVIQKMKPVVLKFLDDFCTWIAGNNRMWHEYLFLKKFNFCNSNLWLCRFCGSVFCKFMHSINTENIRTCYGSSKLLGMYPVLAKTSEFVLALAQYCNWWWITYALEGKTFFRQHITNKVSKFRCAVQIHIIPKYIILIQIWSSTDYFLSIAVK